MWTRCKYSTSSQVSPRMSDHLGMLPAIQIHSTWPSFRGLAQWVPAKAEKVPILLLVLLLLFFFVYFSGNYSGFFQVFQKQSLCGLLGQGFWLGYRMDGLPVAQPTVSKRWRVKCNGADSVDIDRCGLRWRTTTNNVTVMLTIRVTANYRHGDGDADCRAGGVLRERRQSRLRVRLQPPQAARSGHLSGTSQNSVHDLHGNVFKRRLQLRFDCNSTALRPLDCDAA